MKPLLAFAAVALSVSAHAATPDYDLDWTVVNADKTKIYTILPKTAIAVANGEAPYVTATAEYRLGTAAKPERFRISVTGCEAPEVGGRSIFSSIDGKTIYQNFLWVLNGGRVFDALSMGVCNAYGINRGTIPPLTPLVPRQSAPSRNTI